MLTKFIIIVTFAISSAQSGDPANYTKTQYGTRLHTQPITDTQGRLVWFNTVEMCELVAAEVLNTMKRDINVIPQSAKCVPAQVDSVSTQK
jgi:hypothetical protein